MRGLFRSDVEWGERACGRSWAAQGCVSAAPSGAERTIPVDWRRQGEPRVETSGCLGERPLAIVLAIANALTRSLHRLSACHS